MIRFFLLPLLWAAIILLLSSIPSSNLPDFSLWEFLSFDKIIHVALYGMLSFLVMKACVKQYVNRSVRYHAARIAAVSGIVYGGLIELMQAQLLTDRQGDWMDLVSNIVGTFLGIWIFRLLFIQYIR